MTTKDRYEEVERVRKGLNVRHKTSQFGRALLGLVIGAHGIYSLSKGYHVTGVLEEIGAAYLGAKIYLSDRNNKTLNSVLDTTKDLIHFDETTVEDFSENVNELAEKLRTYKP